MRTSLSIFAISLFAACAPAQEIKVEKMAEVKGGSVFIRNGLESHKCTGSGFVVSADGTSLLVATNAHVISPDEYSKLAPSAMLAKLKQAKITILFGSGTVAERSATAEVLSIDPTADICILKVRAADVKDPPKALKIGGGKALVETSTVYSFGYPFGDALSTGKGPAVTVGKASISSLRTDEAGKLAVIQVDGNLNPGNSGGPVIDTDGNVIGVATAIHRDGKGIGFVVPAAEVQSMLTGKVSLLGTNFTKQTDGRVKVTFEALVSNPSGAITGVTLNYKLTDPKSDKPKEGADLSSLPGAKLLELKLAGTVARGELILDANGGQLSFSARPSGTQKGLESTPNSHVSLGRAASGNRVIGIDDKPPAGWKEIGIDDKFITVWVPEKSGSQVDRKNTYRGPTVTVNSAVTQTTGDNGVIYRLERASLRLNGPGSVGAKLDTVALREAIARSLAEELRGKIVEESDAKLGTWASKEYVIKGPKDTAIVRIHVSIRTVYIALVQGPAKAVSADDGNLFLDSFRVHPRDVAGLDPNNPRPTLPGPGPTIPGPTTPPAFPMPPTFPGPGPTVPTTPVQPGPKNAETKIVAGMFDPVYRDYGPQGGFLIGFELGLGKFFDSDVIISGRPIYRSRGVESFGAAQGTSNFTKTIKAKDGYAIGAVSLSSGMTVNGLSVTYMRIAGDKLDSKDSYESEWVGIAGRRPDQKIAGTGTPFVGVVGKANPQTKYLTGLGLIFASSDSSGFTPPGGGVPNTPIGGPAPFDPGVPFVPSQPNSPAPSNPPSYSAPGPSTPAPAPASEPVVGRWAIIVGGVFAGLMLLATVAVVAFLMVANRSSGKRKAWRRRPTRDEDDD